MLNNIKLNDRAIEVVKGFVSFYKGETILSRQQLREAHGPVLTAIARKEDKEAADVVRASSPHFITRNARCQVKDQHGKYNLAVFFAKNEITVKVKTVKAPRKSRAKSAQSEVVA